MVVDSCSGSWGERSLSVTDKADVAVEKVASSEEKVNRIIALLPEDQTKLERVRPDRTSATLDMKNTDTNSMSPSGSSLYVH